MTLLFQIIRATHANGTHHKLALDALKHLRGPDAEAWRRVFLKHAELYMTGSKAPDKEFKDFTNHVLHVRDGYWGGAAEKAVNWYGHLVTALRDESWSEAVYAAGVLSHYYTDPIMPFHTAQSDAETAIHRAVEWSANKSYENLMRLAKASFPMPDVPIEDREDWLADLVCDGAEISNQFYEKLIADYDFDIGVVDPPRGFNDRAQRTIAQLLCYAQCGLARILERAFTEAGVAPPEVTLTAQSVLATLKIPLKWVLRKMDDASEKAAVQAMYDELQDTGSVVATLTNESRVVGERFHADVGETARHNRPTIRPSHVDGAFDYKAVLDVAGLAGASVKPAGEDKTENGARGKSRAKTGSGAGGATGKQDARGVAAEAGQASSQAADAPADTAGEPAAMLRARAAEMAEKDAMGETAADAPRDTDRTVAGKRADRSPEFRLKAGDEVEEGPSVGPKTALRLNKIGIVTVEDLLEADAADTAEALDVSYVDPDTVREWQAQAGLQCSVPGLSGTTCILLVGAGIRDAAALGAADAEALHDEVRAFAGSPAGERVLRGRGAPERDEIHRWITCAGTPAASKAA